MILKTLAALAFVGAMVAGTPQPSQAQGVYLQGPGIEFGIGPRYHHYYRHHRYYDGRYRTYRWDEPRYRYYRDW